MSLSNPPAPSVPALLDAQNLVVLQLEAQVSAADAVVAVAHEKMVAAVSEHELAVDAARRARDALASIKGTFARVGALSNSLLAASAGRPPRVLNPDVLAEIFTAWNALPLEEGSTRLAPPFVAASISRQWRSVALVLPSIWCRLVINWVNLCGAEEYIGLVLDRSRDRPLDVHFHNVPAAAISGALLSNLSNRRSVQALARTGSLTLGFMADTIDLDTSFLPLLQCAMPVLESLTFLPIQAAYVADIHLGIRILTLCSNLRVLALSELFMDFLSPHTLPNIEKFSITASVIDEDMHVIARAWPKLQELTIGRVLPSHGASAALTANFGNLRALHCTATFGPLKYMCPQGVPVLRDVTLLYCVDSLQHFGQFIGRSMTAEFSSLESITLIGRLIGLTEERDLWTSVAAALPKLTTLELRTFSSTALELFFEYWSVRRHLSLPPKLHTLHLNRCTFDETSTRILVEWLAARQDVAAAEPQDAQPLGEIRISQYAWPDDEDSIFPEWMVHRLEQLVQHVELSTVWETLSTQS